MEKIKAHIFNHFNELFLATGGVALCLFLLMVRVKITHSFFLFFLVWNLFLAAMPFAITLFLGSRKKLSWFWFYVVFAIWLLFLPNAPYIITDLIHLQRTEANMGLLDIVLILAFASCGLLFYFLSLRDMEQLLLPRLARWKRKLLVGSVPFMIGFGIYLGRFERWNSWDVLQQPRTLLGNSWELLAHPSEHRLAWLCTFFFGIALGCTYWFLKRCDFFTPSTPEN
ncbi:MAG: DUF1361 domain-containing protein [Bacteroidota bacterium]